MAKVTLLTNIPAVVVSLILTATCLVSATSISTQLSSVAEGIADRFNEFAGDHGGMSPKSWDDLRPYIDFDRLYINLGGPIETKMLLLADVHPTIAGSDPGELAALTAFPINEDRRKGVGRYVVYRRGNGKFAARWEAETTIQQALSDAKVAVPPSAVYQEQPLLPLDPVYGIMLIQDAVKHGVPIEQAAEAVENHVRQISKRRSKPVKTWAELVALVTPPNAAATTPVGSPVQPFATATPGSPRLATSIVETPVDGAQKWPVWLWLVGVIAIGLLGATIWIVWRLRK
jgi:hypothetical protein